MSKQEYQSVYEEMFDLNKQIMYHADLYFNKDTSEITDPEYDELVERFEVLAEHNPAEAELFEVARKPVPIHEPEGKGLKIVNFSERMLSLKKTNSLATLGKWFLDVGTPRGDLVREAKVDGLALELEYDNGTLVSMITRGDGMVGEDVFHSLRLFDHMPMVICAPDGSPIKGKTKVRGEAYITIENYHQFNQISIKPAATPRNGVSGWVRALPDNQNELVVGVLKFAAYWCDNTFGLERYSELKKWFIDMGFGAPPDIENDTDIDEMALHYNTPMDGVVFKCDKFEDHVRLGVNNRHPNWALALKYPDKEHVSKLQEVVWSTAATGRVVPVAHYETVVIGGVSCSTASLDNYKQFLAMDLHEGSVIAITRNGDVIPRVRRVIERGNGVQLKAPEDCPSCKCVLQKRITKTSADLVCTNTTDCSAQLVNRCINLVHRRCLDIKDLGPVKLTELVEMGLIHLPVDILKLGQNRVGKTVFDRIFDLISRPTPVWLMIKAFGLPGVDILRAKKIAAYWPRGKQSLLEYLQDPKALMKIPGVSAGIAFKFSVSFEDDAFTENAEQLMTMLHLKEEEDESDQIFELKVCMTGTVGQAREDLVDYLGDQGIELSDNLTKDCNYLLVGERPGQSKLLKATELGIPTIDATQATSIDALIALIKKESGQ